MNTVRTCLWFAKDGEAAARFYTSVVTNSAIESVMRPSPEAPALVVNFTLNGVPFMALNGGPQYTHSPAASILVQTCDQVETDQLWNALIADGGKPGRCGWLVDRFGISWQVIPEALPRCMMTDDKAAAQRVHAAMMQMTKLEIAELERALRGA